jgi:transposase-like protein
MITNVSDSNYRFPPESIQQTLWLYVRFTRSFRGVEDLLADIAHAAKCGANADRIDIGF